MADAYQVPPHSVEAEQAVLGGLMLDNKTWHLIADQVRAEDFYRSDHRMIFKAISQLADRGDPFDVITISEAVEGQPGSTNLAYIAELARNTPSVANVEAYARVVSDRGHLRQLISVGHDQIRIASQPNASAQDAHEQCENPRPIDYSRVDAQQGRRMIDRLVGWLVSKEISSKRGQALSAGRVQSVATRLIVERCEAVRQFVPIKHFGARLDFKSTNHRIWKAKWQPKLLLPEGENYWFEEHFAARVADIEEVTVVACETTTKLDPPRRRSPLQP